MNKPVEMNDWIGVDWGTSHLRAWLVSGDGAIRATAENDRGMGTVDPAQFEDVLIELIAHWLPDGMVTPVIACGMVGSRQGWVEAPYRTVPCSVFDASELVAAPCSNPRISVHIIPGIKQTSPPDVMRSEETQIAGFIANNPKFDGVLCLPGTHTKWVRISAEEVVSFETYMTGETFALLGSKSVLQHGIGDGWDDDAFKDAVSDAIAKPEKIAARLFTIRAAGLIADLGADAARARLSGLLIGSEIAAARPYWLGQDVVLIGGAPLCSIYQTALAAQGAMTRISDGGDTVLVGLAAARKSMLEGAE